jgi:predicted DNA-binding transcriptional regulator AlpA
VVADMGTETGQCITITARGWAIETEVCAELQVAPSTFYEWRMKRTGPRCIKLSNAKLRIRRADLYAWLAASEDAGAAPWERSSASARYELLTVGEVCAELQVAASTFYEWRMKRTGPRCIKLPNSQLRIRRAELDAWLAAREDAA